MPQIPPSSSNTNLRSRSINTSDRDLESASSLSCRICFDNHTREGDELIAPCRCKGSQEFVHRECLDNWRSVGEGFAFTHCSTCKAAFRLQVKELIVVSGGYMYIVDYEGMIHKAADKYFILLSSQSSISLYYSRGALLFLIVLGCFCFIKSCIYLANLDQRIAGCQNFCLAVLLWNCLPAAIVIIATLYVFVFCGIAYGLFLATTFVHKSWHRHYRILMKRSLTEVYVVVDQRGHYIPPTLDPRHEQHLRSLNLL
nr:E3 ubiquitin-protein ligase MARCH1 [Ipomoea batatas]